MGRAVFPTKTRPRAAPPWRPIAALVDTVGARRARRIAGGGAIAVAIAMVIAIGWTALRTESRIERARSSERTAAAIRDASTALGPWHQAIDVYEAEPGPSTRAALTRAVQAALARLAAPAVPNDASVRSAARRERMAARMTGVFSGGRDAAIAIHGVLAEAQQALDGAHGREDDHVAGDLAVVEDTQETLLAVVPVTFAVGLLLLALFWALQVEGRRREAVAQTEMGMREHQARFDYLTGLPNSRAFHEALAQLALEPAWRDVTVVVMKPRGLREINERDGHTEGDRCVSAFARAAELIPADAGATYRLGGDEFGWVLHGVPPVDAARLVARLVFALTQADALPHMSAGIAAGKDARTVAELLRNANGALVAARRTEASSVIHEPGVDAENRRARSAKPDADGQALVASALARAVDAKDSYTRSHSETVSALCGMIAAELGLDVDRVTRLQRAGLLHDVGKIAISDRILQKPGPLTAEERAVMQTHPVVGQEIVAGAHLDEEAFWIRHHHERIDGRGYPDGLVGGAIPLESRVILVADAFEALTADRPYRVGRNAHEALAEIQAHAGTQFDVPCVDALVRALALEDETVPAAVAGRHV